MEKILFSSFSVGDQTGQIIFSITFDTKYMVIKRFMIFFDENIAIDNCGIINYSHADVETYEMYPIDLQGKIERVDYFIKNKALIDYSEAIGIILNYDIRHPEINEHPVLYDVNNSSREVISLNLTRIRIAYGNEKLEWLGKNINSKFINEIISQYKLK